mgnify:CR=1 FL=1
MFCIFEKNAKSGKTVSGRSDFLDLPKSLAFYRKLAKDVIILDQNPMTEQTKAKTEANFPLNMPKNPCNNLLFNHIDRFKFFFCSNSNIPFNKEGTTVCFWALSCSHILP